MSKAGFMIIRVNNLNKVNFQLLTVNVRDGIVQENGTRRFRRRRIIGNDEIIVKPVLQKNEIANKSL